MNKKRFKIEGMTCSACLTELKIVKKLMELIMLMLILLQKL